MKFFKKYPEILTIMSEKKDGSMRLFYDGIFDENNAKNRARYFRKIGIKYEDAIAAYLIHGVNVEIIKNSKEKIIPKTDVLITKEKGIYLSVTAADCIPVMFYDAKEKIIGIVHAGWRGIVGEIIKKTINKIIKLGGKIENIMVAMGPGINSCHFSIAEDNLDKFEIYSEFIEKRKDEHFVDLKGIIRKQLFKLGIKEKNIENNNDCTFCNKDKYYSYRREKVKNSGLMVALIGMK